MTAAFKVHWHKNEPNAVVEGLTVCVAQSMGEAESMTLEHEGDSTEIERIHRIDAEVLISVDVE